MRGGRGEDLVLSSSRNGAQRQPRAETTGYFRSQGSRLEFRSQAAGSFRSREQNIPGHRGREWGRLRLPPGCGLGREEGGELGAQLGEPEADRDVQLGAARPREGDPREASSPRDRGSRLRYREASPGLEALWLPGRFGCGHGHGLSSAREQRPPDCGGGGGDREDCLLVARSFSAHCANASRAHAFFGSPTPISAATGKRSAGGSQALARPRPLRSA